MRYITRFSIIVLSSCASAHAGVVGSISGSCSVNDVTTPIDAELLEPEVTVFDCISVGVPWTRGLASVQLMTADSECSDLTGQINVSAVSTPEELAMWGITEAAGASPPFPIAPCPPTAVINYGKLNGSADAYSFSIGSLFQDGPVITKTLLAEMTWNETIEIVSPVAQTLALPVSVSGSVFAAESFGTAATRGYAKLSMTGSVGGAAISDTVEVESVSTIPEQAAIDVSRLAQVPVSAGSNFITVNVTGQAEVITTAQGAGFIAGSATAGVIYSDSITIGRFVAGDGGPLPAGVVIRSASSATVYEDTTCQTDFTGDGSTGFADLTALLSAWGPCAAPCPPACETDLTGDCSVGFADLTTLLSAWGACD